MIPAEAVEAAVKAWDRHWGDRYGDEAMDEMGEEIRIALKAAAAHMQAEAWDGGYLQGRADSGWVSRMTPNPYRPAP